MPTDWTCHLCGQPVSWGTPVCPRCGSALDWQEYDEDDPLAHLMPPGWDDSLIPAHKRRVRAYAIAAVVFGLLVTLVGLASNVARWPFLVIGPLFLVAGAYALLTLPNRHP